MFPGIVTLAEGEMTFNPLSKEQVDIELAGHGGTIVEIKKTDGKWAVVKDGALNRRITVYTEMQISSHPPRRYCDDRTGAGFDGAAGREGLVGLPNMSPATLGRRFGC